VSYLNDAGLSEDSADWISDNAAGGIAYLTIIPAVVFLLSEPYRRSSFVRFNAWQSIFLFAAWLVVAFLVGVSQGFAPSVALLTMSPLQMAALGFFAVWATVGVKAFHGTSVRLPVIGALAEKQASR
jgi:uncharacterized membrane protein